MIGWIWYVVVQLLMLLAKWLGLLLILPIPCALRAWVRDEITIASEKDRPAPFRIIDRWRWKPLNWIYGNPEDGVSGQTALVWYNGNDRGPYLPNSGDRWRAYAWSGWRNSCDALKYAFAWRGPAPPYKEFTFLRVRWKIGWQPENGFNVPIGGRV